MQEQEIEFLEEYKRVEAICCDMFSCDHGVSAYIEALEQAGPCAGNAALSRDGALKTLRRLRWLRNQIVHGREASDCSDEDIENISRFHDDLLHAGDPLALLRKAEQQPVPRPVHRLGSVGPQHDRPAKDHWKAATVIIFAAVLVAVILLMYKLLM